MLGRSNFPPGFLFGAATAAYQIEGSKFGGAGPCHWDTFAATPGNVVRAEDGSVACDHYHHWAEDLDLLKAGGFDTYRFSTNWARVLPEGRGAVNEEGLAFYDRLVDGMLERGLKPNLTLYHWDLPATLADLGGWTNPDVAHWFADYARVVMARIGDRVEAVATINEPWCVSFLSHFLGEHAPGLRDIRATARSMHYVLAAHAAATSAMRADGFDNIGIVLNFSPSEPATDNAGCIAANARADAIANRWFVQALAKGTYPDEALEGLAPHMPKGWQDDMAAISQPIDWLGVNYYTRALIAHAPDIPWPSAAPVEGPLKKTQMGWEIYPKGLADLLVWLRDDYVGDLPVRVTENGMAWGDEMTGNRVEDPEREAYIADHMAAMKEAIDKGVNLQAFYYWSLLDNYEWALGYEKRFGIVHVDFDSLQRTPKASYHALSAALSR